MKEADGVESSWRETSTSFSSLSLRMHFFAVSHDTVRRWKHTVRPVNTFRRGRAPHSERKASEWPHQHTPPRAHAKQHVSMALSPDASLCVCEDLSALRNVWELRPAPRSHTSASIQVSGPPRGGRHWSSRPSLCSGLNGPSGQLPVEPTLTQTTGTPPSVQVHDNDCTGVCFIEETKMENILWRRKTVTKKFFICKIHDRMN